MADLELSGLLDLSGDLALSADGGKVTANGKPVLVELTPSGSHSSAGIPVILPPPPASPVDTGTKVVCINSFNKTVKAGGKPIVALGMTMQGNVPSWPGMMLPSQGNVGQAVSCGMVPANVEGDQAITFPNGGAAALNTSGQ